MKVDLIKKINKLIIGKVVEIIVAIMLVGLSIPAWHNFSIVIGEANTIKKEDYHLIYNEITKNEIDFLTVKNNYALNKNYTIYLEVKKETDLNTEIFINNKNYILKDFIYEENKENKRYTLINKNILNTTDAYKIKLNFEKNKVDYNYIFEENNNF